jgi:hypothetical protein
MTGWFKGDPPEPPERETDEERDARFYEENDRIWGKGNWLRCSDCPLDAKGREIYHHKDLHKPRSSN